MGKVFFVTRHAGAQEWARANGYPQAIFVDQLETSDVGPGDTVVGTIPIHVAEKICRRGARIFHLAMETPIADRGRELSADEMEKSGARLIEYRVRRVRKLDPRAWLSACWRSCTVSIRRPRLSFVRWLRACRRWLADRPTWMVAVLGLLGLVVLTAPSVLAAVALELAPGWLLGSPADAAAQESHGLLWLAALVLVAVYSLAFYVLSQIVGAIMWSRMRRMAGRDARCRAMVMGLSWLTPAGLSKLEDIKQRFAGQPELYALPTTEFEALTNAGGTTALRKPQISGLAIQWQQNVRAIHHHMPLLERVLVLPSEQSLAQWDEFRAFIAAFFPNLPVEMVTDAGGAPFNVPVVRGEPARSHEDYAYVRDGLSRGVDLLLEVVSGLEEGDICIDVTAGPKTFSIAGAIVTLNRDLKLGYVSVEGNVSVYEAEIGTADSLTRTLN